MLKMRREGKEQKKNILLKQQTQFAKPLPTLVKPAAETGQDNPEWLISEDWALLQVRQHLAFCCSVLHFPSNFINSSFNIFSPEGYFKFLMIILILCWPNSEQTTYHLYFSKDKLKVEDDKVLF